MSYTSPTASDFTARYTKFEPVSYPAIQVWLTEGEAETIRFSDDTRARAVMAYAAHKLAEQGFGGGGVPAGVTGFKSGTFSATVSDEVVKRTGFHSTAYGREFLALARRNFAGPRLAWAPDV